MLINVKYSDRLYELNRFKRCGGIGRQPDLGSGGESWGSSPSPAPTVKFGRIFI